MVGVGRVEEEESAEVVVRDQDRRALYANLKPLTGPESL